MNLAKRVGKNRFSSRKFGLFKNNNDIAARKTITVHLVKMGV